jgi:pimeloyl-ACP methyl ester carboxylesterase
MVPRYSCFTAGPMGLGDGRPSLTAFTLRDGEPSSPLRSSRPTRFLAQDTPRLAAGVTLAQDAIELADALNLDRFAVIGHDWGARAAYTMAALFAATSESFLGPDWVDITLNAYRARWMSGEVTDARYVALQRKLGGIERLATPTLMIQGTSDSCDAPKESECLGNFFTGGYKRLLLDGVGHFPHREAPQRVADAIVRFFGSQGHSIRAGRFQ